MVGAVVAVPPSEAERGVERAVAVALELGLVELVVVTLLPESAVAVFVLE